MSSYETKKENTKSYLLEALVDLLKETPLSQLTVSALTRKAGVSRGTFYLHYLDINDFIKTIEENLFLVIEENLQDDLFYDSGLSKLRYLIAYVEKNYAIFQILIGKNGDKNFEQRLIDLIKQFIVGNIDKNNQHFNIPKDYILDLLTMSVVSIIYTWFDEETPRTSQEIIDIKKQAQGISFNEKLAIERAVQQRNPDVLALREVSAKGKVTYDDDFYLLNYELTYIITLPSSRSMKPVEQKKIFSINEVFVENSQLEAKKDFMDEDLFLILEDDGIDLKESVIDNILLNIPLRVLTKEEEQEQSLPSGQNWSLLSEEQYQNLQKGKKEKSSPFAALEGLFDEK